MLAELIALAIRSVGDPIDVGDEIRFASTHWKRVLLRLSRPTVLQPVMDDVAERMSRSLTNGRVIRWGPSVVRGAVNVVGDGAVIYVMGEGLRRSEHVPVTGDTLEILHRTVTCVFFRATTDERSGGDEK